MKKLFLALTVLLVPMTLVMGMAAPAYACGGPCPEPPPDPEPPEPPKPEPPKPPVSGDSDDFGKREQNPCSPLPNLTKVIEDGLEDVLEAAYFAAAQTQTWEHVWVVRGVVVGIVGKDPRPDGASKRQMTMPPFQQTNEEGDLEWILCVKPTGGFRMEDVYFVRP